MSEKCVVTAIITPKPEHLEAVMSFLVSVIPEVHAEPGCEFYTLNKDTTGRLIFIEAWTTRQHWMVHNSASTVARINEFVAGKLASPVEVSEMYAVPAGTPAMGQL